MATLKQIQANRRNSKLSTGPASPEGKAAIRMNALQTGIDAQSQIITGEDPEALERLTARYYDRFQPQGPEEVALIDTAISSDWLLRRLRKTEAEIWDRPMTGRLENEQKWNKNPEPYRLAAAYQSDSKLLERLQRRISAAERSLRASLETLARLRKVGQALSPGNSAQVLQAPGSAGDLVAGAPPDPPPTPSKQNALPEIGFVPEISPAAFPEAAPGPAQSREPGRDRLGAVLPEPTPAADR